MSETTDTSVRCGYFDDDLSDREKAFILDAFAEFSPLLILALNLNTGKISYASAAWEEITGLAVETLFENPMTWMEIIHPEDREYSLREFQAALNGPAGGADVRILHKDGTIHWINSWPCPASNENFKFIVATTMNITERKRVEEELKKTQVELEQTVRARTIELEETNRKLENSLLELSRSKESMEKGLALYRGLTIREKQVFDGVVAGETSQTIADTMEISLPTVKVHRGRIMKKMEVGSIAELAVLAVRSGLLADNKAAQ